MIIKLENFLNHKHAITKIKIIVEVIVSSTN